MSLSRPARSLLAPLLLAAVTAALYFPVRGLFFTKDDPAILAQVLSRGVASGFVSPETWQAHNRLFFTPLLNASLGADLAAWGFSARPFYTHHVAAIFIAAVLLFVLLSRSVPRAVALASAVAFLAGAPVAEVATQLMSRHYIEGLALSLGAVLAWTAPDGRWSRVLAAVAALLSVLAASAKEVFLPLPLLLLLLPGPNRRGPFRIVLALLTVSLSLAWRFTMLGTIARTYAPAHLEPGALAANARALAASLPEALLGLGDPVGWLALGGFLLAGAMYIGNRNRIPAAFGAIVLFAGPILPVAAWVGISSRYVLVGWTLLAVLIGLAAGTLWSLGVSRRAGAVVLLAAFCAISLAGGRSRFTKCLEAAERESAEGRFFLASKPGDVLVDPATPIWTFRGLARLRETYGPSGEPGVVANDVIAFCSGPSVPERFFEYSPDRKDVVPQGPASAVARQEACRRIVDAPLSVSLSVDRGLMEWELGPPLEGTWGLVFVVPAWRFDVPRTGRHHLQWPPFSEEIAVRARYTSPGGWVTYSPELRAKLESGRARLTWRRP